MIDHFYKNHWKREVHFPSLEPDLSDDAAFNQLESNTDGHYENSTEPLRSQNGSTNNTYLSNKADILSSPSATEKKRDVDVAKIDLAVLIIFVIITLVLVVSMYMQYRIQSLEEEITRQRSLDARELVVLNRERLDSLEVIIFAKADFRSGHQDLCPICLDSFVEGRLINVLPCGHLFDIACIKRWLLTQNSQCPMCKYDVREAFLEVSMMSTERPGKLRSKVMWMCTGCGMCGARSVEPPRINRFHNNGDTNHQVVPEVDLIARPVPIVTPLVPQLAPESGSYCSRPSSREALQIVSLHP